MSAPSAPIGVVLAGGAGRRMGGGKAVAAHRGRPLLAWALDSLAAAGIEDLAIACKRDTELPPGCSAAVWTEPDEPRHPLAGMRHALLRAGGRPIVTLPVDVPDAPAAVLARLAAGAPGRRAVVVRAGGRVQPLAAWLAPEAAAALEPRGRATDAILALHPLIIDVPAAGWRNVNARSDLA